MHLGLDRNDQVASEYYAMAKERDMNEATLISTGVSRNSVLITVKPMHLKWKTFLTLTLALTVIQWAKNV